MALTPLSPHVTAPSEVLSGTTPPSAAPSGPAVYYQVDLAGAVQSVYYWDTTAGWTQLPAATAAANWSEGLLCGWDGKHDAQHAGVAHAEVALASVLTPRFSVAVTSTNPVPFEILDTSSGTAVVLATGNFPPNAKFADAGQCTLVDTAGAPVGSFAFVPSVSNPVAHYAAAPVGGHAAMPADGEGFYVHWRQVY